MLNCDEHRVGLLLQSYAESTIKEMLGWYGLQDSSAEGVPGGPPSLGEQKRSPDDSCCPATSDSTADRKLCMNGYETGVGCQPLDSAEGMSNGEIHWMQIIIISFMYGIFSIIDQHLYTIYITVYLFNFIWRVHFLFPFGNA